MAVQIRELLYRLGNSCIGMVDNTHQSKSHSDIKLYTMRTMDPADNHSGTYVNTYNKLTDTASGLFSSLFQGLSYEGTHLYLSQS